MKRTTMIRLALDAAEVFRSEFPGEAPDISWMAEAAAIDEVPDSMRDAYFAAIQKALLARGEPKEPGSPEVSLRGYIYHLRGNGQGAIADKMTEALDAILAEHRAEK